MNRHPLFAFVVVFAVLAGAPSARAACADPAYRAALVLAVAEAQQLFADMDEMGFLDARDRARVLLPCMVEPLEPADVAHFHGMMALDAFLHKDDAGAVNAFRAALAADSSWTLPASFVPEGHPVRLQYQVATSLKGVLTRPLPSLAPDAILVDGETAVVAPSDRPVLLQRVGLDGLVVDSVWISAGGGLPAWTSTELVVVMAPLFPEKHPVALAGVAGASLLASGVCYGLAFVAHDAFVNPDTVSGYPENPQALQSRANVLTWTSIGAAALGMGLGTVAAVRC